MLRQTINWKKGKNRESKTIKFRLICIYRQTDKERKKGLTKIKSSTKYAKFGNRSL